MPASSGTVLILSKTGITQIKLSVVSLWAEPPPVICCYAFDV
jgi:hypothetical protein